MSTTHISACAATRLSSPEDRSSMTATRKPSPSSASTTCEPMKPAPPVTIALPFTARNLYGASACALGKQLADGLDDLVDPLEHPRFGADVGQLATGGDATEHHRDPRPAPAQLLDEVADLLGHARTDRAQDDGVRAAAVDCRLQAIQGQLCVERGRISGGGELVVDHLQLERVLVALEPRHQHLLARGLAAAGHVAR